MRFDLYSRMPSRTISKNKCLCSPGEIGEVGEVFVLSLVFNSCWYQSIEEQRTGSCMGFSSGSCNLAYLIMMLSESSDVCLLFLRGVLQQLNLSSLAGTACL